MCYLWTDTYWDIIYVLLGCIHSWPSSCFGEWDAPQDQAARPWYHPQDRHRKFKKWRSNIKWYFIFVQCFTKVILVIYDELNVDHKASSRCCGNNLWPEDRASWGLQPHDHSSCAIQEQGWDPAQVDLPFWCVALPRAIHRGLYINMQYIFEF